MESFEGKKGQPRLKPPFPAGAGIYGCPTTVNNVESIAVVGTILRRGADWFARLRHRQHRHQAVRASPATSNKPCVVEEAVGIPVQAADRGPLRRRPRRLGQPQGGDPRRHLGADDPGRGVRRRADDYEDLQARGSGLGTGAMIVMDKDADLVRAIARAAYFYKHESCGQCTPCREGTGWMWRVMERMVTGEAEMREIDMLLDVASQVEGHTICGLGDAAAWPIQGLFRHFRHEVEERITQLPRRQAPRAGRDA